MVPGIALSLLAGGAWADDLSVDSNFTDTSNQNPTLCIHFTEALKPGLDAHYEDYVKVDQYSNIVTQVSRDNLCIGGLPYAKTYKVTLLAGLAAESGDKLPSDTTITFALGDRPPLVAIGGNGLYLAKRSATGLAVTSVNIKKLTMHILRLNNLAAIQNFAASQQTNISDPTQQVTDGYSLGNLISNQAGVVWSGTMAVNNQQDAAVQTLFPVTAALGQSSDRMAGKPGVYMVVAEDGANAAPAGFWTGTLSDLARSNVQSQSFATHWIIVTDIGLTAITGDDGLHLGVRAVSTAKTLPGIRLDLISQGGDVLASVTSDANGNAVIPPAMLAGKLANTPIAVAAYGADGDFSYLPLDRAAFDLSDRGVTGRAAPTTNDAFIFADRGIYRPGETAHATVLLRDADGKALPNQKITLGLLRPDTVQVATIPATTDAAGGAVVDVPLPATAAHGSWTVQAAIDPTLPPIGTLKFDVQNFRPATLRVVVTGAPDRAAVGDKLNLQATGTYLYGAPASLPVDASITLTTDSDPIPGQSGYSFGLLDDQPADAETDIDNTGADAAGKISLQTTMPAPAAPTTAPLQAKVSVGFVEPSGLITRTVQNVKLVTTADLIGIKPLFQDGAVNTGAPATFSIAAFNAAKPAMMNAGTFEMRIVRTNTVYDWVGSSGSWTWRSYTVDHPVELGKLALQAGSATAFTRSLPDGDYTLIVSDPKTGAATSVAFSVGWAGIGTAAATPDTLSLSTDHKMLAPGGSASVKISGPFAGMADLVVANNRVYSQQQIDVPKGGASATVTAGPNWNGGAYVIADLHRGSADAPGHASVRAIGLGWIGLDPAPHTLGVQVLAPAKVLPRTHQTITVKIAGATAGQSVHLVMNAVDEGILGLTRYTTPDPVGWFWGQRKLGIEIRDMFGQLLNDQGQPGSIQQGGDESGGARLPMQSTKLFAVASGDLTVGADGTVQIPLDVPDFEGQARLSATAWSVDRVGSGMADMIVRDPVVMTPGLPNFLATGDTASLPVTLNNIEGPAGAYRMTVKVTGLGVTAASASFNATLAQGAQDTLRIPVTAGAAGVAQLDLELTNQAGLKIDRQFQIPVRPAHPPALAALFGKLQPGAAIAVPAEVMASGAKDGTARFALSTFPGLDPATLLDALSQDTDQTDTVSVASRAFPLLNPAYAAQFKGGAKAAAAVVTQTIAMVVNRQGMDGDIGEWSFSSGFGLDGFNDWVTAYATDFLVSAHVAGYDVPQVVLDRSAVWLRSEATSLTQNVSDQGNAYGSAAPAPFPSFVYVEWLLARTGRIDIGALRLAADALTPAKSPNNQNLVFWGSNKTPNFAAAAGDLAKLAMALQLAGDTSRANHVLQLAAGLVGTPGQNVWTEGFFWSGDQDAAIVLLAAATMGNQPVFAQTASQLDPQSLVSNQDDDAIAWLLRAAAAGDRYANAAGAVVKVSVGSTTQSLRIPGATTLDWAALLQAGSLKTDGGSPYYGLTARYIPQTQAAAFAHGMTLRVSYNGFDGKPLNLGALRQGQDVAVTISGTVPKTGVHKLGIVALLPGCFTVEKTMPGPDDFPSFPVMSQASSAITDVDRFLAVIELGKPAWESSDDVASDTDSTSQALPPAGQFTAVYLAKVTTAGSFTLPEVTVRDRLHPAINAGSGSQTITVVP